MVSQLKVGMRVLPFIGLVWCLSANDGSSCLLDSSFYLSHKECQLLCSKVNVVCFAVTLLDRLEFSRP